MSTTTQPYSNAFIYYVEVVTYTCWPSHCNQTELYIPAVYQLQCSEQEVQSSKKRKLLDLNIVLSKCTY